jgi:PKD repeat protein
MQLTKLPNKPLYILLLIVVIQLIHGQTFAQLTANFSASITNGCAPAVINFTDNSTGNPNQWKWDLGNGTISTLQNPSVSYFNPGQYTIKLVVKNSAGQDSVTKQNYITIHAGPIVSFSSSATRGCFPSVIQFTDATLSNNGTLSTWEWDFGDGQIANLRNTQHTYIDSGIYNVTLKITNVHGCVGTLQKTRLIEINGVKANFRHYVQNRCYLNKELFLNQSYGNGNLQYRWSFGDGNQSNLLNFENTYNNGGTYNAKLVVSNQFGCKDSVTKVVQVDTPMTARFTANATRSCRTPFTVQFNNIIKQGNIYKWSFGDGATSTDANPTHTYLDSGKYTVMLTVTNSLATLYNCIDSVKKLCLVYQIVAVPIWLKSLVLIRLQAALLVIINGYLAMVHFHYQHRLFIHIII